MLSKTSVEGKGTVFLPSMFLGKAGTRTWHPYRQRARNPFKKQNRQENKYMFPSKLEFNLKQKQEIDCPHILLLENLISKKKHPFPQSWYRKLQESKETITVSLKVNIGNNKKQDK